MWADEQRELGRTIMRAEAAETDRDALRAALCNLIELVEVRAPEIARWPDMDNARAALSAGTAARAEKAPQE